MNKELSSFAAHLRGMIPLKIGDSWNSSLRDFDSLALELFELQFKHNSAYRKICAARGLTPQVLEHWTQCPAVPTAAFKELELSSLPPEERTTVFHSSGTTAQKPSRHFHSAESLAVYEASLISWFFKNVPADLRLVCLTPSPEQAPHSSLVHMFETVRQKLGGPAFVGRVTADGAWTLDFTAVITALSPRAQSPEPRAQSPEPRAQRLAPRLLLGTAFSFVHLLDYLAENNLRFQLPEGSRVMETGGYKNQSRTLPKPELHALITERLGIPPENILCEYGMSELSSQAYECGVRSQESGVRSFHFPPWARVRIISPETGLEVKEGETGLIRIFDLANVFSVAAIQTEDLGIRRGEGFELVGRARLAESRGCSLMTA